ncbi:MAG: DUF2202 domain-containing protein [Saprospiraceae bacterium]|nr:DUF2202 domain-containing protein [Saprospiraceae bacterium]
MFTKFSVLIVFSVCTVLGFSQPKFDFSEADQESVKHMVEEERLAFEIYQFASSKWDQPIFQTICTDEKFHLYKIKALAKKYAVESGEEVPGTYDNQGLQDMFTRYQSKAVVSEKDALLAVADFEERDIVDLQKYFKTTDNADLIVAYEYLLEGAKKHLRMIYQQLTDLGMDYKPAYMHEDHFNEIVLQIPISLR